MSSSNKVLPLFPSPIHVPSSSLSSLPARPHRHSTPLSDPAWTVSTHVFPAAFPRKTSSGPSARLSKDELERRNRALFDRQRSAVQVTSKTVAKATEEQGQLFICVNRYARSTGASWGSTRAFTLVTCHATGLHKETWEPALSSILTKLPAGVSIDEIWSLDSVHQGDSALLNDGLIGSTSDWLDFGRDCANFVASYLPSAPASTPPPRLLPYHAPSASGTPRRLVGLGHSLGAAAIAVAASILPSQFTSIVLVDGVMFPPSAAHADAHAPILAIAKGALGRKDAWPTREAARAEMLAKKEFYGKWDPEVLDWFVQFGLVDVEGGTGVRLKTRREHEAMVFADPERRGSEACFAQLQHLPPWLHVHWVFAGTNPIVAPWAQPELVAATAHCRMSHTAIAGSGHLIVQEKPEELGREIARFLGGVARPEKL